MKVHVQGAVVGEVGAGSRTLMRGLDLIEALSTRKMTVLQLAELLGLGTSTAHRLATALADRGYVVADPSYKFRLGPKLLELEQATRSQVGIVQVARRHMEALAAITGDAIYLAEQSEDSVLYLDIVPSLRRVSLSDRVGSRTQLTFTALGKALLFDHQPDYRQTRYTAECTTRGIAPEITAWSQAMMCFAQDGFSIELEENEDGVNCVAAPVRAPQNRIIAAIGVMGLAGHVGRERLYELADSVRDTAEAIGQDLRLSSG